MSDAALPQKLGPGCTKCPYCGANLVGAPIPEENRKHYGGKTHFGRVIGLSDRKLDRTTAWMCPDCFRQDER